MKYRCRDELEIFRKSDAHNRNDLRLFGVKMSLGYPVIEFKQLSKKYIYDTEGMQYPYPSKASALVVFDNKLEAWNFFKDEYVKKKKWIKEYYEMEMQRMARATTIIDTQTELTPEYFI